MIRQHSPLVSSSPDLERLGDYLLGRHRQAIKAAEMEEKRFAEKFHFSGHGLLIFCFWRVEE